MKYAELIERELIAMEAQLPSTLANAVEEGSATPAQLTQAATHAAVATGRYLIGLARVVDAIIEELGIEDEVERRWRDATPD